VCHKRRKLRFILMPRTHTGAYLGMCSCPMAPTSTIHWSVRLVLVVSEVCAGGYGPGTVREGRPRGRKELGDYPHPVPSWERH
jgi:hypothetical protein